MASRQRSTTHAQTKLANVILTYGASRVAMWVSGVAPEGEPIKWPSFPSGARTDREYRTKYRTYVRDLNRARAAHDERQAIALVRREARRGLPSWAGARLDLVTEGQLTDAVSFHGPAGVFRSDYT